jgi:endo-1,4-beta-xylanase
MVSYWTMTVPRPNSLLVPASLVLLIAGCCCAASVLEQAARNIERYRKGDATIEFLSPDGGRINGAQVKVEQTSHDFLFGNYIRPRHYNSRQYLDRFKELFNFVELLEFNWGQYEPDQGKPLLKERMNFIRNWCVPNGVTHFYGHMLVWTRQYGDYPRTGLPVWLFNYDKTTQYQTLKDRIQREVADYKDIDMIWDVVNEAVHCRVWGDWDKDSYIQNKSAEPLERIVPYVGDALSWAHQANPDAKLLINDYRVIVEGSFRRRYKQLIDTLLSKGAPLSVIGIQAHEPFKGKYWYSPEDLWQTYELFGSQTGLPIYITEFFYVSDEGQQIRGNYRHGHWSPDLQADAVEEFYRVSFGHPSVRAIIYFGLSDSDVVQPKCGLLDEQYNPKPAWTRLKKLIWDEWTTKAAGRTSGDGTFSFRGFFGRYKVTVRFGNAIQTFNLHLEKGKPNRWQLTLDAPSK